MDELTEKLRHTGEAPLPNVGQLSEFELARLFDRTFEDVHNYRVTADVTEYIADSMFEQVLRQSGEYWDAMTGTRG